MGTSTDGIICYGWNVGEDPLPWDGDFNGDEDKWWKDVNGYQNPLWSPYTPDGELVPELAAQQVNPWDQVSDPRIDEYHAFSRQWAKENPFPVELVNTCSGDCPMYIMAVAGSVTRCLRGYPESFDPSKLVFDEKEFEIAQNFLWEHKIETGEPRWWLASFWG